MLVEDLGDLTRTYRTTTFTDSEAKTYAAGYWVDELNIDLNVVTWHHHFYTFGESDLTSYVKRTDVELWTILVVEWSVTTTFFLLQDVDRSLEARVRLNLTWLSDHHTTLDFVLVDTTEEKTDVVTSLTFVKDLTEHFDTRYNGLEVFSTETDDLYFVTCVDDTRFDTTRSNRTTTCDREYVFYWHEEGLIDVTWRQWDPCVYCIHEFHYLFFPLRFAIESTKSRTTDNRSVITIEVVAREQLTHVHLDKLEHFLVVYHIALVHEDNKAWNVYLTSEQNVLTSLRHRTIRCSNNDDSTVHLSSTRYHVLHIVSVPWAVYVSIVTVSRLILYVRGIDRDTTLLFFRSIVDRVERTELRETLLSKHRRDCSSKGRLTVVNVTDRTNIYVWFRSVKCFFSHN